MNPFPQAEQPLGLRVLGAWPRWAAPAATLACLALFVVLYREVLSIEIWRHDSLFMLSDYDNRLTGEGRWINYLLFAWLRGLPPQIAVAADLVCWGVFSWAVAHRLKTRGWTLALFVAFSMQIPAFYSVIGWPVTLLPTFALLAAFSLLAGRVPSWLFFAAGGIAFFGGLNNFYNLLLILLLPELQKANPKAALILFLQWVAGFVLGYLTMLVMVRILGGQWGLTIAAWRHASLATSLPELLSNLRVSFAGFFEHVDLVGVWSVLAVLGLTGTAAYFDARYPAEHPVGIWSVAALVAVALATYVQAAPYGLTVEPRTAIGLFGAIFALTLLLLRRTKLLGVALAVLMAGTMYTRNFDSIHFVATMPNVWRDDVRTIPVEPARISMVHVCSTDPEIKVAHDRLVKQMGLKNWHNEWFDENNRMSSILRAAGFMKYEWWFPEKCAAAAKRGEPRQTRHFTYRIEGTELYLWHRNPS